MKWTKRLVLVAMMAGCSAPEARDSEQSDVETELTSTAADWNIARGGSIDVRLNFYEHSATSHEFAASVRADLHSRRPDCQVEVLSPECKLISCNGPYYGGDMPTDVDTGQIRVTASSTPGALNSTPDPRTHQYAYGTTESSFRDYNAPPTPYVGPGDRVRVETAGGAIPAVGLSVVVASAVALQPNALFLANPDWTWPRAEVLNRKADLVTTWTGGPIGNVSVGILRHHFNRSEPEKSKAVSLECVVPSAKGELALASSWLQRLPTGIDDNGPDGAGWTFAWVRPSSRATALLPSPEGWAAVDLNVESFLAPASAINASGETNGFTIE